MNVFNDSVCDKLHNCVNQVLKPFLTCHWFRIVIIWFRWRRIDWKIIQNNKNFRLLRIIVKVWISLSECHQNFKKNLNTFLLDSLRDRNHDRYYNSSHSLVLQVNILFRIIEAINHIDPKSWLLNFGIA